MTPKENKNLENTTEENPVSAEPKEEISESVAVGENIPVENLEVEKSEIVEDPKLSKIIGQDVAEEKNESEQVEEISQIETEAIKSVGQEQEQKVKKIPQAENLPPVEIPKVEQKQPISSVAETVEDKQTQEIPAKVEIKTVEKIVYKTDPNFIKNLLNKARAKIQERKRKKLDKIMALFETKSQISNSDVQKLLRTARRSAVRYLDLLEKEQKITQIGNVGKGVRYTKKQ